MSVIVHHGDCLDVLRGMAEASVDSVVTDPPAGISFMGREWDHHKGGRDAWVAWMREVAAEGLRVAKPGAHALVWALPRTSHWTATAWEDAGWEVRDRVAHLFGTGFPKSLDIGKAIDRARNDDPAWKVVGAWLKARRVGAGMSAKATCAVIGAHGEVNHGGALSNWENGFSCPTWDQWLALKALLGFGDEMDAEVWRLNGRKGQPGEAWHERETIGQYRGDMGGLGGERLGRFGGEVTAPATDAAKQWQGWGTALKPAVEDWWLLRKPRACPTVAAQVLATGTGALNVDGCRVETGEALGRLNHTTSKFVDSANGSREAHPRTILVDNSAGKGRWPANLCHDGSPEVLAAFEKFGPTRTPGNKLPTNQPIGYMSGAERQAVPIDYQDGGGSPARFFYSAKASKAERAGSKHPTVKPLALMRWLCRLVTPPGGLVLDMFAGTGVTGEAALLEGFGAVLVEREAEHVADIRRRLGRASGADTPLLSETAA